MEKSTEGKDQRGIFFLDLGDIFVSVFRLGSSGGCDEANIVKTKKDIFSPGKSIHAIDADTR